MFIKRLLSPIRFFPPVEDKGPVGALIVYAPFCEGEKNT
jgi:hypothetical protein